MTGPPVITKYRRVLPYELMSGLGYEPLYAVAPAPATLSPSITETYFPYLLEILERDSSALKRRKRNCRMYYEEMTTDGLSECELPKDETGIAYVAYILPYRQAYLWPFLCDKKYHKDDLAFGTIISAPYYSQKRDDTISTYDYNTGVTAFDAVYSKHRKMVIIECWAEHVVC
ncbi:unnamed protein product [Fusarium venenatum]|uniref:Uncharacterized protein n=1 Tax=Fusarium venenatum TaxID=56646 RepID=A0A2L2TYW8_9HYPO|nr:uncharacterized protein FVRRES_03972 [Fusarium venenatum]CEI67460.1 unnamed protein product [Fusarium venenatum]